MLFSDQVVCVQRGHVSIGASSNMVKGGNNSKTMDSIFISSKDRRGPCLGEEIGQNDRTVGRRLVLQGKLLVLRLLTTFTCLTCPQASAVHSLVSFQYVTRAGLAVSSSFSHV